MKNTAIPAAGVLSRPASGTFSVSSGGHSERSSEGALPPARDAKPGPAGLVISAKTRQLFPETLSAEIPASLTPDLVFPAADLVNAATLMFPSVASPSMRTGVYRDPALPGFVETRGVVAAEGAWPRIEIAAGVVRLTRIDLAAVERRLSRASDQRAKPIMVTPDWCTCGGCAILSDKQLADLDWWGTPRPTCPGLDTPDAWPMAFVPEVVETVDNLVTSWSRKSRANLRYRMLTLDLAEFVSRGRPGMTTLTLPGDWFNVAPTAAAAALCFDRFARAWAHKWGEPLSCVWKREFQRRGAPHWHLWCIPPSGMLFRRWLSLAWAESIFPTPDAPRVEGEARHWADPVVGIGPRRGRPHGGSDRPAWGEPLPGHEGPARKRSEWCKCSEWCRSIQAGTGVDYAEGMRASDPHRLATYFLKESGTAESKAYQNVAPVEWAGGSVGRFWGVRKLKPFVASVEVAPVVAVKLWRSMRKVSERQFPRRTVVRVVPVVTLTQWIDESTGVVHDAIERTYSGYRKRRPVARPFRVRGAAGWVGVNNGAAFGAALGALASDLAATPKVSPSLADRVAIFKATRGLAPGRPILTGGNLYL